MLVATETFWWSDPEGYNSGEVKARVTFVSEDHRILKTHRHCFRPAGLRRSQPPRSRASSTPARMDSLTPELRDTLSATPFKVSLPDSVIGQIEREIHEARHVFGETLETGGLLLGLYRNQLWPPRALVVRATGPGPESRHGPASVRFRPERIMEEWPDMFETGLWHSHPGVDDVVPSETDLRCWRDSLEQTRSIAYVGVIATPSRDIGWMAPQLHAWVLQRSYQSGPRCEPALIVD